MGETAKPDATDEAKPDPVELRKPAHALGLQFIGDDFDAPMPDLEDVFAGDA